jgi:antibiotic biosynthesis monooxygenase (ABM) superfamily enzyme
MVKIEIKQIEKRTIVSPYSKRAFMAIIVAFPMAFGLNISLSPMVTFMPVWGVIMINVIVISSYMTFIIPKTSKLLSSWLGSSSTKINQTTEKTMKKIGVAEC